jgi:hypothetical protein
VGDSAGQYCGVQLPLPSRSKGIYNLKAYGPLVFLRDHILVVFSLLCVFDCLSRYKCRSVYNTLVPRSPYIYASVKISSCFDVSGNIHIFHNGFNMDTYICASVKVSLCFGKSCGSGSAWIRINLSCWIRIRIRTGEGKNAPQK